jgi:hypothetical protein
MLMMLIKSKSKVSLKSSECFNIIFIIDNSKDLKSYLKKFKGLDNKILNSKDIKDVIKITKNLYMALKKSFNLTHLIKEDGSLDVKGIKNLICQNKFQESLVSKINSIIEIKKKSKDIIYFMAKHKIKNTANLLKKFKETMMSEFVDINEPESFKCIKKIGINESTNFLELKLLEEHYEFIILAVIHRFQDYEKSVAFL